MDSLIEKLSFYGTVRNARRGYVFSLLITGSGLTKIGTVIDIHRIVSEFCSKTYPIVEVTINDDDFLLIILRPAMAESLKEIT